MTTIDQQDLDSVDLADPPCGTTGPPMTCSPGCSARRRCTSARSSNVPDEGGFWSITRFDDVRAVSRDHRTFSSERRGIFHMDDIGVPLDMQRLQMISMDPPRHDRLKALVIKEFTPEAVGEHEEQVKQIISHILDSVADRERFDLVADVARPIPARVIGSLLGTPPEDDAKLVHWTNVFTAFEDPAIREQWRTPWRSSPRSSSTPKIRIAQRDDSAAATCSPPWSMPRSRARSSTSWKSPRSSSC